MGRKKKIEGVLQKDFDFGNIELPEFDPSIFDLDENDDRYQEESRYTKPSIYTVKQDFICYENAGKLARELTVNKNGRADVFVSGAFIFGDFIEAYIVQRNARVKKMTVSTLSLSQENVDSLHKDEPLRSVDHPTMKPLKLIGRLIKTAAVAGDIVLDMFGGSGSTMMAAEQLVRICYMVELDPRYCDVIIKRREELTGQTTELESNIFVSDKP